MEFVNESAQDSETPEVLSHIPTGHLRKLRAQMVAGSDIHDKLGAVVGLVSQMVDGQLTHPKRVKRDKAAASAAEQARKDAEKPADALNPIAAPYEPPAQTLFSEAPKPA